jgi:penicillin-insensitive murein DD-endopeptidase
MKSFKKHLVHKLLKSRLNAYHLILCLFVAGCSSFATKEISEEFSKWAAIKTPSTGESKIYGSYQMGCLAGAKALALKGDGYFVVRKTRERYYGHPVMINYITELGKKLKQKKYPIMIIEDISYPRGGPFLHGHNSHQIGLDVDISLKSVRTLPTTEESENWVSPSYVEGRKNLLSNWTDEQINLTVLAADSPEVNRIFVAPAIKKYFCTTNPAAPWLYKLRSWWGHDDHLHVRLNCPADSAGCVPQAALDSSNNGCGVELDWWYSAEADADWEKIQKSYGGYKEFPKLPSECESVKLSSTN